MHCLLMCANGACLSCRLVGRLVGESNDADRKRLLLLVLLLSARSLPLLLLFPRPADSSRVCVSPLRFALIRPSSCLHKGTPLRAEKNPQARLH